MVKANQKANDLDGEPESLGVSHRAQKQQVCRHFRLKPERGLEPLTYRLQGDTSRRPELYVLPANND